MSGNGNSMGSQNNGGKPVIGFDKITGMQLNYNRWSMIGHA